MSRVHSLGTGLCHNSEDRSVACFDNWGMCEDVLVKRQCFRLGTDQSQVSTMVYEEMERLIRTLGLFGS